MDYLKNKKYTELTNKQKNKIRKLINIKIGRLTSVKFIKLYKKRYYFKFKCSCGNYVIKNIIEALRKKRNNIEHSCGCAKKEAEIQWDKKIGEKLNGLTITKYLGMQNKNSYYEYQCHCGNFGKSTYGNLKVTESCRKCVTKYEIGNIINTYKLIDKLPHKKVKVNCLICNKNTILSINAVVNKKSTKCTCNHGNIRNLIKEPWVKYYSNYKNFATSKRKLIFELTPEQFKKLVINNCFYCDDPPRKIKRYNDYFNGIDRINSKLNYTKTNCVSCCSSCNFAKMNLSKIQFFNKILKIYNKHLKNDVRYKGNK